VQPRPESKRLLSQPAPDELHALELIAGVDASKIERVIAEAEDGGPREASLLTERAGRLLEQGRQRHRPAQAPQCPADSGERFRAVRPGRHGSRRVGD
jgi:hypothetical protein